MTDNNNDIKPKNGKTSKNEVLGFIWQVFFKILIVVLVLAILAVFALVSVCKTVADGPSETARDMLVLSALQASATKWVPGLFLDDATVQSILDKSGERVIEEVDFEDIIPDDPDEEQNGTGDVTVDEWEGNEDGIILDIVVRSTFKAYVMLVKDPTRVYTGVSSNNFSSAKRGERIYVAAERQGAVAAINAGEFEDSGGMGSGATPMGMTVTNGKIVWNDGLKRTFIGFDADDRLVVKEGITEAEVKSLRIRDGVSFQKGNALIETVNGSTIAYTGSGDLGVAQRTAIGQRADGAVIMIVTDGRTANSLGATRDDVINLMLKYGAVCAGMLDGGSSAMMYYADYAEKYNVDESELDEYQKLGVVNKYKAFTKPRYLPTFFMVKAVEDGE